ncbi:hypothetical protein C5167_026927 [Papaver somniferum]|nr:hypothetical protein C5167_026927 [Papaver somniferum]
MKSVNNLIKSKDKDVGGEPVVSYDDQRRTEYFLKDQIPTWVAVGGYIALAILSAICVPLLIFPSLKWYHIMIIYIVAPILAFCNLKNWSLASTYDNGGIIAALTLVSPIYMFFSQVIGTFIGVVLSPVVFWAFFYKAYPDLGKDGTSNPAPFGALYRGIALLATQGLSALPKNCLKLCIGFFFFAILVNIIKQVMMHFKNKAQKYLPSPIAMDVPFYLRGYFAIDMCVGSLYR